MIQILQSLNGSIGSTCFLTEALTDSGVKLAERTSTPGCARKRCTYGTVFHVLEDVFGVVGISLNSATVKPTSRTDPIFTAAFSSKQLDPLCFLRVYPGHFWRFNVMLPEKCNYLSQMVCLLNRDLHKRICEAVFSLHPLNLHW